MNREVFHRHRWKQLGSFMEKIIVTFGDRKFWQWLKSFRSNAGRINQSRTGPTNYDCAAVVFWDNLELFVTTNGTEDGGITVRQKHKNKNKLTFIDPENSPIFMTEVGYDVGGTITL